MGGIAHYGVVAVGQDSEIIEDESPAVRLQVISKNTEEPCSEEGILDIQFNEPEGDGCRAQAPKPKN
jgi:hypothetical protein